MEQIQGTLDFVNADRARANPTRWQATKPTRTPITGYDPEFDEARLTGLRKAIYELMGDGKYRTHGEMKAAIGHGSENGISAKLRDLRKKEFGSHTVIKRRRGNPNDGCWEYKLIRKGVV